MLTDIERRLEALTKMQALYKETQTDYQTAQFAAIPPEVQAALDAVKSEYMPMLASMETDIAAVEQEIKAAVVARGSTVTAGGLMAQYTHGRVTYDAKRLDGLALVVPQINECKKVGDPFVVLKPVKG